MKSITFIGECGDIDIEYIKNEYKLLINTLISQNINEINIKDQEKKYGYTYYVITGKDNIIKYIEIINKKGLFDDDDEEAYEFINKIV